MTYRSWMRIALGYLALVSLEIGLWAQFAPQSFFDDFPGLGRAWVNVDGPYNEHLVRDIGGLNLALAAVLIVALITLSRPTIIAASLASLLYGVPHLIYHIANQRWARRQRRRDQPRRPRAVRRRPHRADRRRSAAIAARWGRSNERRRAECWIGTNAQLPIRRPGRWTALRRRPGSTRCRCECCRARRSGCPDTPVPRQPLHADRRITASHAPTSTSSRCTSLDPTRTCSTPGVK